MTTENSTSTTPTEGGEEQAKPKAELNFPRELFNDPQACLDYISNALEETDKKPLRQLELIIESVKPKKALRLLQKTMDIEANGGLTIYNQSRRRTKGGVYFFLAQRWVKKKDRPAIWPELYPNHSHFDWAERKEVLAELAQKPGEAKVPRIVLIGRPGRVIEKGKVVLTSMERKKKNVSWPKGLPPMPKTEGPYIVYISAKQWRKVKQSIRNKKDELIIEGYPKFNPKLKAITVFAIRTSTKMLEQARREKQRADAALKSRMVT